MTSNKRINFNVAPECHALLKSVCAIKGVSVSDYCYELIAQAFEREVRSDPQIRQMFMAGEYPPGSKANRLKQAIIQESNFE
tara:strand:+ start:1783 stop:2028 length:246 start_codon:yes stop_codon:yes gene_type:complete